MVRKHPYIFHGADIVAINKIDLNEAMGNDVSRLSADVLALKPDAVVVPVSCTLGMGLRRLAKAVTQVSASVNA